MNWRRIMILAAAFPAFLSVGACRAAQNGANVPNFHGPNPYVAGHTSDVGDNSSQSELRPTVPPPPAP